MTEGNVPDRGGRIPLHYCAGDDNLEAARQALSDGADPNARDRQGWTPLHFAAEARSLRVAALLLEQGAEVDPRNDQGDTPLMRAVFWSRGDGSLIQLLRGHGADPYAENIRGRTPLWLARTIGNFPVAQWFDDLP